MFLCSDPFQSKFCNGVKAGISVGIVRQTSAPIQKIAKSTQDYLTFSKSISDIDLIVRCTENSYYSRVEPNTKVPSTMRFPGSRSNRRGAAASNPAEFEHQSSTLIPAEVLMISGCHSEQTSADVSNVKSVAALPNPAGRAGGACTSALLEILWHASPNLTFQDLLLKLRSSLSQKGMSQVPQLTSSRPLELQQTPFNLAGGPGRRRALLVGINYKGQSGELRGCINDVFNMKKYLMQRHGFPDQDILVLVDDGRHLYPTRQKIIAALKHLAGNSVAGDSIYFHYSGHGGLLHADGGLNAFKVSLPGGEKYDETLYPLDHERSGQIRDFSLFNHFVKPLRAGVKATCVMDCCHSGSVLDLPYTFRPTAGGTIAMRRNFNSLSNLAFLYILAGGMLPSTGFESVQDNLEQTVDGDLDTYQGTALEELQGNDEAPDDGFDASNYEDLTATEYGNTEDGDGGFVNEDYEDRDFSGGAYDATENETFAAAPASDFNDYSVPIEETVDYDGVDVGDTGIDCGCVGDVLQAVLNADDE